MKLLLLIFSFFGNEVECSICYKRKDLDKNDIKFLLLIKKKKDFNFMYCFIFNMLLIYYNIQQVFVMICSDIDFFEWYL